MSEEKQAANAGGDAEAALAPAHGSRAPEPDGPPPGVHTMAVLRWLLVALMAGVAVLSVSYSFGLIGAGSVNAAATQYYCPMHP